ncbi:MAG: hypothetical protein KDA33_05695, partial [Phycisphaerales bacterium]|nr:hypothetical protein [Phycisphaerales bacterium]
MSPGPSAESLDERLARILAIHFDPDGGAPYWLEKAKSLGFDPRRIIRDAADLPRLGFMHAAELRRRPLSDFTPKAIWNAHQDLVIVQTGGTLGAPIWAAYTPDEYNAAFVDPFVIAARHVGFPTGGAWLYVGPSGPHVIGRAARSIALATGAREPYCVDFDARWSMRLPAGSFAASRYLAHVIDQAMAIVRVQPITHLFSAPPVLLRLAETMSTDERRRILGVHYGGM